METTFDYLRQFGPALAERILSTYPPLQSTRDPVAPCLNTLLRKPLPAQALVITGTAKYLRDGEAVRIVAECGRWQDLYGARHHSCPRRGRNGRLKKNCVGSARITPIVMLPEETRRGIVHLAGLTQNRWVYITVFAPRRRLTGCFSGTFSSWKTTCGPSQPQSQPAAAILSWPMCWQTPAWRLKT
jgi:hypothetical protein